MGPPFKEWPLFHIYLALKKQNYISYLTHNTPLIHTLFTYSKLNMDEVCGLKFYLLYVHTSQKIY